MRNTTVGLLAFALLFGASAGWYGGRSQMASERADIRQELISQLGKDKELMRVCFSDMQNQFTPGYKSSQVMVDPSHPTISMQQGQIFRTQASTNLAVNGEGFFLLDTPHGRRYTRDGRFTYKDGGLASDAGQLLGWKLDGNGKRQGEPVALRVPLDPQTKLYDGLYTGLGVPCSKLQTSSDCRRRNFKRKTLVVRVTPNDFATSVVKKNDPRRPCSAFPRAIR